MEINILFKIAAVGIVVTIMGQILKHSGRDERINRCQRSTEDGNGSGQYVRLACAGG